MNPALAAAVQFQRKQQMQLASKMRYLAAQFSALLDGRPVAAERPPRQRHGAAARGRRP